MCLFSGETCQWPYGLFILHIDQGNYTNWFGMGSKLLTMPNEKVKANIIKVSRGLMDVRKKSFYSPSFLNIRKRPYRFAQSAKQQVIYSSKTNSSTTGFLWCVFQ